MKQQNKIHTYAQNSSRTQRQNRREYFWMSSTVGAPLHTLLSLRLSKAGRRRGSYHSCVISSQLTSLLSHKKVCRRVRGRRVRLLGRLWGTRLIKARSSQPKMWESSRGVRAGTACLLRCFDDYRVKTVKPAEGATVLMSLCRICWKLLLKSKGFWASSRPTISGFIHVPNL